jgi:tetratricopeptide (TPR) repeat protein
MSDSTPSTPRAQSSEALVATLTAAVNNEDDSSDETDQQKQQTRERSPRRRGHSSGAKLHGLSSPRGGGDRSGGLPSRESLLRCIDSLAPLWHPFSMSAAQRQAWYRVGDTSHAGSCNTSKDWLLVGRKYEAKQMHEEAAQCYSRAIRLNPHCASYYFRLGCVQCELSEWQGAIDSFHLALALAPYTSRATILFNLGFAHSEQRAWADAIEALRQAVSIKPRKHVYHNLLAVCYRHQGEFELSINHYKHAIALDRIQPAYRRNLAYVCMQLKRWGAAVRAWSGAIAVAPPHAHAELYRNRAFAQAERGFLASAVEDMSEALHRYTSVQQRRRCQEKLERWTARLQGTEQAYIRTLHEKMLERGPGGLGADVPSASARRKKIKQMAGLIQGEWEEWHGEDVDEPGDPESEMRMLVVQARAHSGTGANRNNSSGRYHALLQARLKQQRRKKKSSRLDIEKATRLAPVLLQSALARDPSIDEHGRPYTQGGSSSDTTQFGFASGSVTIKHLIEQLCLDIPFAEKLRIEARMEKRARRAERHAQRKQKRDLAAAAAATTSVAGTGDNIGADGEEAKEQQQQQQLEPFASSSCSSSESSGSSDGDDSSSDDDSALDEGASDDPEYAGDGSDVAPPHAASAAAAASAATTVSPAARVTGLGASGRVFSPRSARAGSVLSSAPSSLGTEQTGGTTGSGAAPGKCMDESLYTDDADDPYASLSKVFILLRIDAKFLWRFEEAGIHLGNMYTRAPSAEALRPVLPPLGPRLTLMNFMRERVELQRAQAGLPPLNHANKGSRSGGGGSSDGAATGAASFFSGPSSTQSARAASLYGGGSGSGLDSLEHHPLPPSQQETATLALAVRIQHGTPKPRTQRPRSPLRASAAASSPRARAYSLATAVNDGTHLLSISPALASSGEQLLSPMSAVSASSSSLHLPELPGGLPPLLNPINVPAMQLLPVSPHNGVSVHRPLSARDRRVLYDARTHARSAMSPIRTFAVVNWK